MLGVVNRLARALQRWRQGIPSIGAAIYRRAAMALMRRVHRLIAESIARDLSGGAVLDVGCGTGDLLAQLGELVPGLRELICLDISRAMAEIARRELAASGRYAMADVVVGDAHRLPLRRGSVDLVTCVGTLHHLKDPSRFLRECVLVSKSRCLVYEFSHDVPDTAFEDLRRALKTHLPRWVLKLVAALHGVPRAELAKLVNVESARVEIDALGPLTMIVARRHGLSI